MRRNAGVTAGIRCAGLGCLDRAQLFCHASPHPESLADMCLLISYEINFPLTMPFELKYVSFHGSPPCEKGQGMDSA